MSSIQKWSQEEKEEGNDDHLEWKWRWILQKRKWERSGKHVLHRIDELDEVNSNISYEDIHDAFEELYEDFEKLGLKNTFLKKKVQQLEKELGEVKEKFSIIEDSKTYLEKEKRF